MDSVLTRVIASTPPSPHLLLVPLPFLPLHRLLADLPAVRKGGLAVLLVGSGSSSVDPVVAAKLQRINQLINQSIN